MKFAFGIRSKLIIGYGAVGFVALVMTIMNYVSSKKLAGQVTHLGDGVMPEIEACLSLAHELATFESAQRSLLVPGLTVEQRQQEIANQRAAQTRYHELLQRLESFDFNPAEAKHFEALKRAVTEWEAVSEKMAAEVARLIEADVTNPVQLEAWQEGFRGDHYAAIAKAAEKIDLKQVYTGGADPTACRFGKWIHSYQTSNPAITGVIKNSTHHHDAFHAAVGEIQGLLQNEKTDEARVVLQSKMRPAAEGVVGLFSAILTETAKSRAVYESLQSNALGEARAARERANTALRGLLEEERLTSTTEVDSAKAAGVSAVRVAVIGAGIGTIISSILVFGLGAQITRGLAKVSAALSLSAKETAEASAQVSTASHALAAGASEQAASLEETSASLEEINSMTKRNAQNAGTARDLSVEARHTAEAGSADMQAMARSLDGIRQASEEMRATMDGIRDASADVSKIIKTIDEIAFQTNLLALNAAVEAARAGEAGMGFAVVADEVRNLAQRSAKAARETADMIEASIKRSDEGTKVTEKVAVAIEDIVARSADVEKRLVEILGKSREVDAQVTQIAQASTEQAQGLAQVSLAVSEMDKVTQSNASSSEEIASASEHLRSQAEGLNQQVGALQTLITGQSA